METEIIKLIRKILQPDLEKRSDFSIISKKELLKFVKTATLDELPNDFSVNSVTKMNMEKFLTVLLTEVARKIDTRGVKHTVNNVLNKMKRGNDKNA